MDVSQIFTLQFGMGLLVMGLLIKWYLWPYLKKRQINDSLMILIGPHLARYLGLVSLVPVVVAPALTTTPFAFYQGYGDFLTAVFALIAIIAIHVKWKHALIVVWGFNIFGTLDCINSMIHAFSSNILQYEVGSFWFIVTFTVPLLWLTHIGLFALLIQRSKEYTSSN